MKFTADDFSELPVGIQTLAGVRFNLRRLVGLCWNSIDFTSAGKKSALFLVAATFK